MLFILRARESIVAMITATCILVQLHHYHLHNNNNNNNNNENNNNNNNYFNNFSFLWLYSPSDLGRLFSFFDLLHSR
jgi:hypothetical protein